MMHLLRTLSFFVAHFDIYLTATHLPGVSNVTADQLSQGNVYQAFQGYSQSITYTYIDSTVSLTVPLT